MSARDRLQQVYMRCANDAVDPAMPHHVAMCAAENAAMLADCVLHGSEEDCQVRVNLLLKAAPELFPS